MERSLYEEIFYQDPISQEEILTDVDTGEEIIIDDVTYWKQRG